MAKGLPDPKQQQKQVPEEQNMANPGSKNLT